MLWNYELKYDIDRVVYIGSYNHGNNIVGLFDALPNFPFTTSEVQCDYCISKKQDSYK